MKKYFKRFTAILIATFMMLSSSMISFAQDGNGLYEMVEIDGLEMFLISEESTTEDGCTITSRIYSTVNPKIRGVSGSGTYRHEKELEYETNTLKYWVQGYFSWNQDNDTATVSNVRSGYTPISGVSVTDEKTVSANNQGATFLFGNKYAYVRYTFTSENIVGLTRSANVYIDVNVKGEVLYK